MSRILLACKCIFLTSACLVVMNISYAATIDVNATVSGWVKYNGETNGLDASTTNFVTGRTVGNDPYYSNYFVFDLSGLDTEIISASLKLQNPDNGFYSFDNDYFGTSDCCTYYVTSIISGGITASDLLPENWSYPYTGTAVWSEINNGTPVNYGSIQMNESSNGITVEIILNEIAIGDINASIMQSTGNNLFVIGGNLDIPNTRVAYAFTNTGYNLFSRTLTLETNEIISPDDTDSDGVVNDEDAFPNDPTETLDTDGDGVGNNADTNDDDDSYVDVNDNCTLISNDQLDSDGDNYGNACDADFNNDNFVNSLDIGLFKDAFFSVGNQGADMNSDAIVNSLDIGLFKKRFSAQPGPSGFIF